MHSIFAYRRTFNFIRRLDTEQLWMQTGCHLTDIKFIHAFQTSIQGRWLAIYAGNWEGRRILVTANVYTNVAAAKSAKCEEVSHTLSYVREGNRTRTYGVVWTWIKYDLDGLVDDLRRLGANDSMIENICAVVASREPELKAA